MDKQQFKRQTELFDCFSDVRPSLLLFAVTRRDDDVIFVYESRILVPARPDFNATTATDNKNVDDDDDGAESDSSFVFTLTPTQPQKATVTPSVVSSAPLPPSVTFVPQDVAIINISSETAPKKNQQKSIPLVDSDDDDDDDDDGPSRRRKKKKTPAKPLVVLEKLPPELFLTENNVNIETNQTLREYHHHERELLNFDSEINIEKLALHGETSSSKRIERLTLRKSIAKRRVRQRHLTSGRDITVNDKGSTGDRKRKSFCVFCEKWVDDLKAHRKEHAQQQSPTEKYTCEVCGKTYNMKTHLSRHFRNLHGELLN